MARESRVGGPGGRPDPERAWRIWVDTGGTFTDCVALPPRGAVVRAKVLSNGRLRAVVAGSSSDEPCSIALDVDWQLPEDFFQGARLLTIEHRDPGLPIIGYRSTSRSVVLASGSGVDITAGQSLEIDTGVEAPILAAHWVTRTRLSDPLPMAMMRLATTRGTNALLERSGTPTVLFITAGFGDLLEIGNQQRPELFTLNVVKPAPLYLRTIEVEERLGSTGEVLKPLNLVALRAAAETALADGLTAAAVALVHSYRNSRHEDELASFLTELGFRHVSCSSRLAPLIKIVPRAETAVVNAYLSGVIGGYLETVGESIRPGPLHVLTSAGSLVRSRSYLPKDSLLSGPAGGVVGAAATAGQSGWLKSLAFDMGGTSTDVSRFDGELEYRFDTRVGEARLLSPSLAIETVAAGGGSICHFDGRQLKVGPQSAGADPGPACYGAGGPLTLTDVNLLLGRLRPRSFEIPIDPSAAAQAAEALLDRLPGESRQGAARDEILQGLLDIANERMAEAIRRISIRQGYRPAEFALVAFGGAGGQHACALAEVLAIEAVLVPEDAGLLSAVGLGWARIERLAERQILRRLSDLKGQLESIFDELAREAREAVGEEGVEEADIEVRSRVAHLRFAGQETSLAISFDAGGSLREQFVRNYEDHYGYRPEKAPIEIETLRVIASSGEKLVAETLATPLGRTVESHEHQRVFLEGSWELVPVFARESLAAGDCFPGPSLVFERHCSTLVHAGWTAGIDAHRCLTLRRQLQGEVDR